jgi:hypothetical protein
MMRVMSNEADLPPDVPRLSAEDLYWEQVEAARQQSFEEKFLAGADLFDLACEFMRAGIRMQFPDADEARVQELLEERLALARRLENQAI